MELLIIRVIISMGGRKRTPDFRIEVLQKVVKASQGLDGLTIVQLSLQKPGCRFIGLHPC